MTPLFIAWLLALGASVGVAATLTVQWWKARGRWRRIELDDYTERLRALDRHPLDRDTDNRSPYKWMGEIESPRRIR